jgi:hypothetical protein
MLVTILLGRHKALSRIWEGVRTQRLKESTFRGKVTVYRRNSRVRIKVGNGRVRVSSRGKGREIREDRRERSRL